MRRPNPLLLNRRQFVTRVMPACALTCIAGRALAFAQAEGTDEEEPAHKFDKKLPFELTNRQFVTSKYREYIALGKALKGELGNKRALELLKRVTTDEMLAMGKRQAENSPDDSFQTYVGGFRGDRYKDSLTMEIVEDTDRVFELNVTECLWATVFRDADAADIGYAGVCYGDYAWAQGFNPKIRMVRDKTLMQGHECCNHRYLWEG